MTLARWMTPGHLIAAIVFLLPLLAVYGPVQIAALQALAGLVAVLFCLRRRPRPGPRLLAAAALLTALTLWAAASALWSIDPGESLFESARMGLGAVGGLALIALARNLDVADREWIGTGLLAGFCLGLGLLAVEIATQGGLRHFLQDHLQAERSPFIYSVAFNRSAGVLALLAWPAALVLWNRDLRILAVLAIAATAGLIALLENTAPLVGLAVGLALLGPAWWRPVATARTLAAIVALGVVTAPLLSATLLEPTRIAAAYPSIPMPDFHRLNIWQFTTERIAERPLLGWGMDSARIIPGGNETVRLILPGADGARDSEMARMPLHPHNVSLQWWLELGLPGALLGAGLLVAVILACTVLPAGAPVAVAAAGAATLVLMVSYGAWQSWWLGTLWLLAAAFAALPPHRRRAGTRGTLA